MIEHDVFFLQGTALVRCGQTEQKIGHAEKEYMRKINSAFLMPLRTFLDGDMKTIQVGV